MSYEFLVAIRHLRSGGLQTALIIGGTTIGVALFIVISALVTGAHNQFMGNLLGSVPHITVEEREKEPVKLIELPLEHKEGILISTELEKFAQRKSKISSWQQLKKELLELDEEILAVSPKATGQCFISRGQKTMSVFVQGVFPDLQDKVVNVSERMVQGEFSSLSSEQIVIGKKLADELGIKLRDKVRVLSSDGILKTFMVSGIFTFGVPDMDAAIAFVTIESGQQLYKLDNSVTELEVKINDLYLATKIGKKIESTTGYESESWMEENRGILEALKVEDNMSSAIRYFTMLIVAFGIASVLVVSVIEKSRDIGILKAMGAKSSSIVKIFLMEGVVVGLVGALLGAVCGLIIGYIMMKFSTVIEFEGHAFQTFPIRFNIRDIFTAMFVSVFTGFLGGVFPSYRAAKLDPVEVIRYG